MSPARPRAAGAILIRRVELRFVSVPFRTPVIAAGRGWSARRLGLVRVSAGDGLEGVGEIALDGGPVLDAPLASALVVALAGLDPDDGRATVRRLASLARRVERDPVVALVADGPPSMQAAVGRAVRAGAEAAVLDFRGRATGRPVRDLLGPGRRAEVEVNGLVSAVTVEAAAREAEALVATGYRCLKLKVGGERTLDELVTRVAAVRSAIGSGVRLRLDANGAWTEAQAIRALRALGGLELEYVEQPVAPRLGAGALGRVRRSSPLPIAADESVTGPPAAARLVDEGAVDFLVVKPARVGGPGVALQIADHAVARAVGVIVSTMFETGIGLASALHLAAALPGPDRTHGLGTAELLVSDLLVDGPQVVDGRLAVPAGPGLGVTLDAAAVERYASAVAE